MPLEMEPPKTTMIGREVFCLMDVSRIWDTGGVWYGTVEWGVSADTCIVTWHRQFCLRCRVHILVSLLSLVVGLSVYSVYKTASYL